MNNKNSMNNKEMLENKKKKYEVLVGLLLGDGNLQTSNDGRTFRLRILQSDQHKDYVFHLYSIFEDWVKTPPKLFTDKNSVTGKTYERWAFNTTARRELRFYGQQFYTREIKPDGTSAWLKKVPKIIHKLLKPRSLAYWYMDDGALKWKGHSNAVRLCTDSFSRAEVSLLRDALSRNFELETTLQKQRQTTRISISEKSYPRLSELVRPYLIPSMYYKFPDGKKGTLESPCTTEADSKEI